MAHLVYKRFFYCQLGDELPIPPFTFEPEKSIEGFEDQKLRGQRALTGPPKNISTPLKCLAF